MVLCRINKCSPNLGLVCSVFLASLVILKVRFDVLQVGHLQIATWVVDHAYAKSVTWATT